ncbi:uncharacterized protein EV420DRAFT_1479030 [Desarmillaria tabescens]|uniref:Uncharacterized protein n=1 Tax=Armillaria tabescens TaxID=1929756 RepID=A0AA39N742_ARMTA|nr:uncharacterized protein EV420DRAFT_1479030 [Desarmillaria tabescens]KAK0459785.1 hypothetical protein EV420DRAFT_1479030 [Desarmillaria tabescens]
MPCHRSCKKFVPRYPPTYDEALHQNCSSSLHLSVGSYATRYQPYSLSYRFEGASTDIPVPQTPAIVPQTGRFIVPPHYDLDDYIEYDGEGAEEEEASDSDDDDDYEDEEEENNDDETSFTPLTGSKSGPAKPLVLYAMESGSAQETARDAKINLPDDLISTTGSGVEPRSVTSLGNAPMLELGRHTTIIGLQDSAYERLCWSAKKLSLRTGNLGNQDIWKR